MIDFLHNGGIGLKKGFSEEESKNKVSELQKERALTLDNSIQRYGETKGKEYFYDRQRRWQSTINSKYSYEEMQNWRKAGNVSKESIKLFKPYFDMYKDIYTCYIGDISSSKLYEFFLIDKESNRLYSYDFTIRELKLIFEYNGEKYHPNPNWSISEWSSWKQLFTGESADTVYSKYMKKIRVAEQHGFKVVQLWSSTPYKINQKIILDEISAKIQSL